MNRLPRPHLVSMSNEVIKENLRAEIDLGLLHVSDMIWLQWTFFVDFATAEIARVGGHSAVHGHLMWLFQYQSKAPSCSSYLMNNTNFHPIGSHTVYKLSGSIGQIFAFAKGGGVPVFNAFVLDNLCECRRKSLTLIKQDARPSGRKQQNGKKVRSVKQNQMLSYRRETALQGAL